MSMLLIGAAILAGLAVLCLALALTSFMTASSDVDDRLLAYAAANSPFGADDDRRPDVGARVDSFLSQRSFSGGISASLARAGVKLRVAEYLMLKAAATVVPFLLYWVITGSATPGIVLGAIGSFIPDIWLRIRQRRRSNDFVLQLPDTLALIVSGLRAGFSLQQAVVNISHEASEPTSTEFERVSHELQLGVPLVDALDSLVRRIKSEDLDMIVTVFKIHSRVGGNLATVLDTVGATIRERVRLRREIQVITSMQRYSAYILGLLPVGLALVLLTINPAYIMSMFQWNILLCIPIGAGIMTVLGFLVIRKMADIKI